MDPITIALLGGGSSIIGSLFGGSAANAVDKARADVINAERGRQQGFDAETDKINVGSLGRYSNFDQQQAAKAAQLADFFKAPVVTPNTELTTAPLPPVSGNLVQREIDKKNGQAQDYVAHQGDTLAQLRSFGDLMGGIGRLQARDAQSVGQIGGFKKGSQGVEALELDAANHAGDDKVALANIFSGLGKVGLTAALSGVYTPIPATNADGSIAGAIGPTSVGGRPLVGQGLPAGPFTTGTTPFLTYGK